jgi:hypothetical protein
VIAGAVLLVAVLAAYANSYQSGWVLDNRPIVHDDPRLKDASWANVKLIFTQDYWYPRFESGLYRPLTTVSYLVNATASGGQQDPTSYHVVNNLLHALNALLVFLLCRRLTGRFLPALGAGLVFATHPVATEAVTNIVGRADLLATAAVLAGLLIYGQVADADRVGRRNPWLLVALFFVAVVGLLCKESAVALIGLAVVYDLARRDSINLAPPAGIVDRLKRWFARGFFVFVPALLVVAAMRYAVLAGSVPNEPFVDNPLRGAGFFSARLTAVEILGRQLWLLVWPDRLSSDYAFNQIPLMSGSLLTTGGLAVLMVVAVVGGLVLLAVRSRVRNPALCFFILFVFVAYLPVSNLLMLIGSNMAERFMYLPLAGLAAVAGLAIEAASRWISERRSVAVATVMVLAVSAALGARTWRRNLAWVDDLSLARAAAAASPDSFAAHEHLAAALFQADPGQIDAVIAEAERGVAILDPLPPDLNTAEPYVRLATYYAAIGDRPPATSPAAGVVDAESRRWFEKARGSLERARTIDQAFNRRHRDLERRMGKSDDVIADVGMVMLYDLLSIVYQRLGENTEALACAEYARHLARRNAPAR